MNRSEFQNGERLIVLSAPSATGKNTIFDGLKALVPSVRRAITATTRAPRAGEVDGVDYYFLSKEEFLRRAAQDAFVEQNLYADRYYGTPRQELCSKDGEIVVLIIDVNGKEAVTKAFPQATSVFLMPPSTEELRRRIVKRNQNSDEEIGRRLAIAEEEMTHAASYDYVLVNDDIERCVQQLAQIVREKE